MANTNYWLLRLYKHCRYIEVEGGVHHVMSTNRSNFPRRRISPPRLNPLRNQNFFISAASQYFQEERAFQEGTWIIRGNWVGFRIFEMLYVLYVLMWSGSRVKPRKSRGSFYFLKHQELYNLQDEENFPDRGLQVSLPGTRWSQIALIMFVTLVVDNVVTHVVVTLVGDKTVTVVVDSQNSKSLFQAAVSWLNSEIRQS